MTTNSFKLLVLKLVHIYDANAILYNWCVLYIRTNHNDTKVTKMKVILLKKNIMSISGQIMSDLTAFVWFYIHLSVNLSNAVTLLYRSLTNEFKFSFPTKLDGRHIYYFNTRSTFIVVLPLTDLCLPSCDLFVYELMMASV